MQKTGKLLLSRETLSKLALGVARGGDQPQSAFPNICIQNPELKAERVQ